MIKIGEDYNGLIKNLKFWNYAKRFFVPGLLDLYSLYNDTAKIASAYGFRLLFKEYEGAHAKIKRSSDNAELDVTFEINGDIKTPTNFTTWKGSDTLYVTKWYDQSGRGLDVVPTNSSTPPVFDNAQSSGHFMGRWGALFDGTSNDNELKVDNYTNSFGTGEQKYTIFCSTYWDGGTSNDTLFAIGRPDTNRNIAYQPRNSNTAKHYHFSADVSYTSFYWYDQETRTMALRYTGGASNSSNMKKWLDTTTFAGSGSTGSGLNLETGYPLRIGGDSSRGSGYYYEGRIFNFIVLRTDRTDSEVTDITGKLNTYTDDKFTTSVVNVITFESGNSFPDSEWNWVFRYESGSWGGDIVYRLATKSTGAFEASTNRRIHFRSGETPKVWEATSAGYWDGTITTTDNYVSSTSLRFRSPYDTS